MQRLLFRLLPKVLQGKIRRTNFFAHKSATRLATSSKRVDICAAQFAHIFHLSRHPSLEGKTCLEIGAGWVLTHALVCYLLGAKRVIATDIEACARPEVLSLALKNAIASIPRDILAPFSDHSLIRERLDKLLSISSFNFSTLQELGIEYKSPVDFAVEKVTSPIDFIYSNSVLEHVPCDNVQALINNLVAGLNKGGTMIHCIHLEDHNDIDKDPFHFLSIPEDQYPEKLQSERGNRIRSGQWKRIFGNLEGLTTNCIYNYSRIDRPLPERIASSIPYLDEADLRTSHIGLYTQKNS